MSKRIIILCFLHYVILSSQHSAVTVFAQNIPASTEQQLESLANASNQSEDDDTYLQQLDLFAKHPLNLNTADASELKEMRIISELQIENLIIYRKLLGQLVSIYELQAIPGWDLHVIRKLLPFIIIADEISTPVPISKRLKGGDHIFLARGSQILERSAGFDASAGTQYLGSRQHLFFRYRYKYKNLLQFGVTGDKDAGESFLKGAQKNGFDFYSFYLFAKKIGTIQSLAIGDFTANLGQGLIQWQSLGFKKSTDITTVKRSSPVLRPYNSGGEFYFYRGAGITIRKRDFEITLFASSRNLSANIITDTIDHKNIISSFISSGYHRSVNEISDRNNLRQTSVGGNFLYRAESWQVGVNAIYHRFSLPVKKKEEPYNLFAIRGDYWYNFSLDYCYTVRNIHLFGEIATDMHFNKAFINGILLCVDPRVDISFVLRSLEPAYQAVYGNAFTESSNPGNETGFYTGISVRPADTWRIEAYADFYKFPWLKLGADAPAFGTDFLAQLTYTPNKYTEIYTRFRNECSQVNQASGAMNYLIRIPRQSWRTHLNFSLNPALSIRTRVDLSWYDHKGLGQENGFLTYFDFVCKPLLKPFSGYLRLQYFETGGFNSRLYAYENDVLYSYSIPAFFDKGYRYYLVFNYDLDKKISCWARWSQTIYRDRATLGSGSDQITGNKRTEIKLQVVYRF